MTKQHMKETQTWKTNRNNTYRTKTQIQQHDKYEHNDGHNQHTPNKTQTNIYISE